MGRRQPFRITDSDTVKHLDVFQMVLLSVAERTPLPELYEVFGQDKLVQFLDIFAGCTITVPPADIIANAVRDVDIYTSLERTGTDHTDTVDDLARKYEMKNDRIRSIYSRVDKLIDRVLRGDDGDNEPAPTEG